MRAELSALNTLPPHEARTRIIDLEQRHGGRRSLVWSELDESPLALALEHLAILAQVSQRSIGGSSAEALAERYRSEGWRADAAVIRALALVEKLYDTAVVTTAIRAIYLPWAEDTARRLQHIVDGGVYPGGSIGTASDPVYRDGDCILFVDGLRYDIAQMLIELLEGLRLHG